MAICAFAPLGIIALFAEASALGLRVASNKTKNTLEVCTDDDTFQDMWGSKCKSSPGNEYDGEYCRNGTPNGRFGVHSVDYGNGKAVDKCCNCGGGIRSQIAWNYQFTSEQGACRRGGGDYGGYCKCNSVNAARQSAQDCLNYVIDDAQDSTGLVAAEFDDGHCYGFYKKADAPTGKCPTGCTAHEGNDMEGSAEGGAYKGNTEVSADALCLFAEDEDVLTWPTLAPTAPTTTTTTQMIAVECSDGMENLASTMTSAADKATLENAGWDFGGSRFAQQNGNIWVWANSGDVGSVSAKLTGSGTLNLVYGNDHGFSSNANWVRVDLNGVEKCKTQTDEAPFKNSGQTCNINFNDGDTLSIVEGWAIALIESLTFECSAASSTPTTHASFTIHSSKHAFGFTGDCGHKTYGDFYHGAFDKTKRYNLCQFEGCQESDMLTPQSCADKVSMDENCSSLFYVVCKDTTKTSVSEINCDLDDTLWQCACVSAGSTLSDYTVVSSTNYDIYEVQPAASTQTDASCPVTLDRTHSADDPKWVADGNTVRYTGNGHQSSGPVFNFATFGPDVEDGSLEVVVNFNGMMAGIGMRATGDTFYICRLDSRSGVGMTISRNDGSGHVSPAGHNNQADETNTDIRLKMIATGDEIQCYKNGVLVESVTDSTYTHGSHVLFTYDASATFKEMPSGCPKAIYCVGSTGASSPGVRFQIRAGSSCDRGGFSQELQLLLPTVKTDNNTDHCVGMKGGPETGFDTYVIDKGRHCGPTGGYSGYTHHLKFYAHTPKQAIELRKKLEWQELADGEWMEVQDSRFGNSKYRFGNLEEAKEGCLKILDCGGLWQRTSGEFYAVQVPDTGIGGHRLTRGAGAPHYIPQIWRLLKGNYEVFSVCETGSGIKRTILKKGWERNTNNPGGCDSGNWNHKLSFYAEVGPRDCVGDWSDWGKTAETVCSATCGGGIEKRTWTISVSAAWGGTCANKGVDQSRACNEESCSCDSETPCAVDQFCAALECQACPASSMSLVGNLAAISDYTFDSAAKTAGAIAFASGSLEGSCSSTGAGSDEDQSTGAACFSNINDDQLGDGSKWIASSAGYSTNLGGEEDELVNFVGVTFKKMVKVYGISVSRDATGALNDRFGGNNQVQYHDGKGASFDSVSWCDAGSFERTGAGVLFYKFSTPITATAIRIITDSADAAFDDLKVYTVRPRPAMRAKAKRKVKSSMTLRNVVLSEMTPEGRNDLVEKTAVKTADNTGVPKDHITVTLEALTDKRGVRKVEMTTGGGVKINIVIELPEDQSASDVVTTLQSSSYRDGVSAEAVAILDTEPAAAKTGSIEVEAPTVMTEAEKPSAKIGDWVLGFKVLKGSATGLTANNEIDAAGKDFLRANRKVMITWNTESELTDADSEFYQKYEKAVEFTLPVPTNTMLASKGGATWGSANPAIDKFTCNHGLAFSQVDVECKWGECNMPSQMYTGIQFQKLCSQGAYGLIKAPASAWCYGHPISTTGGHASFRFLYAGPSGSNGGTCNGYVDDLGHVAKDTHMHAIAVWFQKDLEGHGHGDPHLKNIKGEDFDVMQEGQMLLLETPRHSTPESMNFAIRADIDRLGAAACGPTYITSLYLAGKWLGQELEFHSGHIMETPGVHEKHAFGLRVNQKRMSHASFNQKYGGLLELSAGATVRSRHRAFQVSIKSLDLFVSQPKRPRIFLDMQIKGLETLEGEVGGLLGQDDHSEAEKLPEECLVA